MIDATGKFLEHATIYPTPPHNKTEEARRVLLALIDRHGVELIAVGSGTASRETDAFVASVLRSSGAKAAKVTVNESGASIYSASETARAEFPDLDLTVRGAISIARRLQDPLAELVKIDPKSIGVGQYQHDVNQAKLRKMLDREVESCVNLVGVDLNTASVQLLSYVSGIGPKMAESIQRYRDAHGAFPSRESLLSVPRLGNKVFPAGGRVLARAGRPTSRWTTRPSIRKATTSWRRWPVPRRRRPKSLVGNTAAIRKLDPRQFVDERVGLPTIADIIAELEKPGRDPRQEFRVPQFAEGVHEIGRPARRHDPRGRGDERHAVRRLCRRRRSSGWAGPRLGDRPTVHQGPDRGRRRGQYHPREGPAGGPRTPADRALPETGRLLTAFGVIGGAIRT